MAMDDEALYFIEGHKLMGRGIGYVVLAAIRRLAGGTQERYLPYRSAAHSFRRKAARYSCR